MAIRKRKISDFSFKNGRTVKKIPIKRMVRAVLCCQKKAIRKTRMKSANTSREIVMAFSLIFFASVFVCIALC